MGSKKKSAPAPVAPDYTKLANQQAELQNQMIDKTTQANRVDQVNPLGSVSWQQDPATGRWTQTETWTPELKQAYDAQLALSGAQRDASSALLGKFEQLNNLGPFQGGPALPSYDASYGNAYAKDFMKSALMRVLPQQEIDRGAMESKLRLQGLQPGTEAYNRAYQNLLTSQGDVVAKASIDGQLAGTQQARDNYLAQLQGQGQGFDQALKSYLLPWQTTAASAGLLSQIGSNNPSVQGPSYQGYATSGNYEAPQILNAAQQQYAQQMQIYNEQQKQKSGKGGALGSIAGAAIGSVFPGVGTTLGATLGGGLGSAFSDMSLKSDVEPLSDAECYERLKPLIPIEWRWTGSSVKDAGISAQQIEAELPHLVDRANRGLLRVNYTALFAMLLGAFRHLAAQHESVKEASDAV